MKIQNFDQLKKDFADSKILIFKDKISKKKSVDFILKFEIRNKFEIHFKSLILNDHFGYYFGYYKHFEITWFSIPVYFLRDYDLEII